MNFINSNDSTAKQPPKFIINLQQSLSNLQTHFTTFLQNLSQFQNPSRNHTLNPINPTPRHALWARISNDTSKGSLAHPRSGFSVSDIEERLAGVPVYALSNSDEEFVLVSGASTGKSLGLLCFNKDVAEALLKQMQSMDPGMRNGSRVVPVALNKVFQLKVDGVAFRLIPEFDQIKNAIEVRQANGFSDEDFPGVPVFQSRSLILKSKNKSFRPVFFRKEDLENSLLRASRQQNRLNPALKQGDVQVAVFEEMLKAMKESTMKLDDIVFIPPGFDVSTDPAQQSASGSY